MGQAVTDCVFRAPMLRMAALRKATGAAPTWTAEFRWPSPVVLDAPLRAAHCLDMPFMFQKPALDSARFVLGPEAPQGLADRMHGAVAAFVRGEDPGWAPWEQSGRTRVWDWPQPGETSDLSAVAAVWEGAAPGDGRV